VLRLDVQDSQLKILWNDRVVLTHSRRAPAFWIGSGEADYRCRHGSYKIRERQRRGLWLGIPEVTPLGGDRFELVWSDELILLIEVVEGRLHLRFEGRNESRNRLRLRLAAEADESIWGCGEQYTHLDLKGRRLPIWTEEQGIGRGFDAISLLSELFYGAAGRWHTTYFPLPTFVSSARYAVHCDVKSLSKFDFRAREFHDLEFWTTDVGLVVDSQPTLAALVGRMSQLLGRQPPLPEWAFDGAWLGIQGGNEVVRRKTEAALSVGTKVAAIWAQDWEGRRVTSFGKQLWWNWQYDSELYPNLPREILHWREKGIRFLGYCNPFLATERSLFEEARARHLLVRDAGSGEPTMVKVTTFPAAQLDLTNPETRLWMKEVIKRNMIGIGLSGWMADFGEWFPPEQVSLASGESPELAHNPYPAQWAELNREAIVEAGRGDDVVFFARAGYTNSVRHAPIFWAGDQLVNWSYDDGLASVIPAAISLGLCGVGVTHADVGGYTTVGWIKRSKELFLRWAELGAFSPIMRTHEGNRPEANWQFDSDGETLSAFARLSRIHAALKPYWLQLQEEYQASGLPFTRHMALHFEEDSVARSLQYQFMLGRDLLVAPVCKPRKRKWRVYLPSGDWCHLWSGESLPSGWNHVEAPLGKPPVFWRSGSSFAPLFASLTQIP
jgi:alpha-glucosidase